MGAPVETAPDTLSWLELDRQSSGTASGSLLERRQERFG